MRSWSIWEPGCRRVSPSAKTVDFAPGNGTDYVVDLMSQPTPFEDESVDLVICTGVFEHVTNMEVLTDEALRILRPGGAHELAFGIYVTARRPLD